MIKNIYKKVLKYIKENKIACLVFLLLFIVLCYTSFNTFLGNDDLPYSFFKRLDQRVTNLFQVVWDNLRYYKSLNGRFLVHCVVMTLLIFGKNLWSILNPLVIVSIIFLMYKIVLMFIKKEDKYLKIILPLLLSILFLSMYNFKSLIYWVAGSVNYIWVLFAIMLFIYFYLKKGLNSSKKLNIFFLLILSSLHENSLVFCTMFIIIMNIIDYIKNKKCSYLIYFIPVIIGGCILLLAPGNMNRTSGYEQWYSMNIFERLNESIPYLSSHIFEFSIKNIIPLVYSFVIIINLITVINKKPYKYIIPLILLIVSIFTYLDIFNYSYFILAILLFISDIFISIKRKDFKLIPIQFGFYALAFSMVITPLYYSLRPNLLLYFYFMFAICKYINAILKNKNVSKLFIVAFSIILIFLLGIEINIYYNIGKIHKERILQIEKFNESNSDTLYLTKIPIKYSKYHMDSNNVNEDYWTYRFFIWYYDIKDKTKIKYK